MTSRAVSVESVHVRAGVYKQLERLEGSCQFVMRIAGN